MVCGLLVSKVLIICSILVFSFWDSIILCIRLMVVVWMVVKCLFEMKKWCVCDMFILVIMYGLMVVGVRFSLILESVKKVVLEVIMML